MAAPKVDVSAPPREFAGFLVRCAFFVLAPLLLLPCVCSCWCAKCLPCMWVALPGQHPLRSLLHVHAAASGSCIAGRSPLHVTHPQMGQKDGTEPRMCLPSRASSAAHLPPMPAHSGPPPPRGAGAPHAHRPPPPAAAVDLLHSANTRVLALQRQVADKDAQLAGLQQQQQAVQVGARPACMHACSKGGGGGRCNVRCPACMHACS